MTAERDYSRATKSDALAVLEFLVPLLRPRVIYECGTYPGRATSALYWATEVPTVIKTWERVHELFLQRPNLPEVQFEHGAPASFAEADLTYIDSGPTYADRIEDISQWLYTARRGSWCVIDDTKEPWFDKFRHGHIKMKQLLSLPTEQGTTIWQR